MRSSRSCHSTSCWRVAFDLKVCFATHQAFESASTHEVLDSDRSDTSSNAKGSELLLDLFLVVNCILMTIHT